MGTPKGGDTRESGIRDTRDRDTEGGDTRDGDTRDRDIGWGHQGQGHQEQGHQRQGHWMGTPRVRTPGTGTPETGAPGWGHQGSRHLRQGHCDGDTRERDARGGDGRYRAPTAAQGWWGQAGEKGGIWQSLGLPEESNGTSERAVPRTGPPSRSAAVATSLSPRTGASRRGARQQAETAPAAITAWSLPVPPLPAPAPQVLHPRLHPAPQALVTSAVAAWREHPHIRASLEKLPHKSRYPLRGFGSRAARVPRPGTVGAWGTVSRTGRVPCTAPRWQSLSPRPAPRF